MDYETRLKNKIKQYKNTLGDISDYSPIYCDFLSAPKFRNQADFYIFFNKNNGLYYFIKEQKTKRAKKENFNKFLFSKILFNNFYRIRQEKKDAIPFNAVKGSGLYNYFASHQYIRRELEHLEIDDIMLLCFYICQKIKPSKRAKK